jgi:ATP-dependent DNA ligase I
MLYKELVNVYEQMRVTSKRLEKTYHIAELLKKSSDEDLHTIMLLLQGIIFPAWEDKKIGVAAKLVLKSINVATGVDQNKIEQEWRKAADLGEAASSLIVKKKQNTLFSTELEVRKVFGNLTKLADMKGAGSVDSKVKLIAELLTSATPTEAKYIVKTVLEEMRVGVGEGSLRDAIAWAYFPTIYHVFSYCMKCNKFVPKDKKCLKCTDKLDKSNTVKFGNYIESYNSKAKNKVRVLVVKDVEEIKDKAIKSFDVIVCENEKKAREVYNYLIDTVQEALDISNDFGETALLAKNKGLSGLGNVKLEALSPVKVMLYKKATDILNAFEQVLRPAAFEFKYDGFRLQIHKKGAKVKLYTRRLEDVTEQFPDVAEEVMKKVESEEFILDSEVIGVDVKTGKYLPFQQISQRIKRKYDIDELIKKVPVVINIFDAIMVDGKSLLKRGFSERRDVLKRIVKEDEKIKLADQLITADNEEAEEFYAKALEMGNEGVMAKSLEAPYKPGSRVGYGVKVKPTMDNLDLVVVKAEWGEGKRGEWLSSFTVACRDYNGELLEIGKVSTGLKEKTEEGVSFEEMTKLLRPLISDDFGREVIVRAKIVIEVAYEEVQKSSKYSSGYALRFPRVVNLRVEKPVDEIATLEMVEELFFGQN